MPTDTTDGSAPINPAQDLVGLKSDAQGYCGALHARRLPSGWWLAPAIIGGLIVWSVVIAAIANLVMP